MLFRDWSPLTGQELTDIIKDTAEDAPIGNYTPDQVYRMASELCAMRLAGKSYKPQDPITAEQAKKLQAIRKRCSAVKHEAADLLEIVSECCGHYNEIDQDCRVCGVYEQLSAACNALTDIDGNVDAVLRNSAPPTAKK